jgi:hypothetical protein
VRWTATPPRRKRRRPHPASVAAFHSPLPRVARLATTSPEWRSSAADRPDPHLSSCEHRGDSAHAPSPLRRRTPQRMSGQRHDRSGSRNARGKAGVPRATTVPRRRNGAPAPMPLRSSAYPGRSLVQGRMAGTDDRRWPGERRNAGRRAPRRCRTPSPRCARGQLQLARDSPAVPLKFKRVPRSWQPSPGDSGKASCWNRGGAPGCRTRDLPWGFLGASTVLAQGPAGGEEHVRASAPGHQAPPRTRTAVRARPGAMRLNSRRRTNQARADGTPWNRRCRPRKPNREEPWRLPGRSCSVAEASADDQLGRFQR